MKNYSRFPEIHPEEMSEKQLAFYEAFNQVSYREKGLSGPFSMWVRYPELANLINQELKIVNNFPLVEERVKQLVCLILGRYFNCQHLWSSHLKRAYRAGISEDEALIINKRGKLNNLCKKDHIACEVSLSLAKGEILSEDIYNQALIEYGSDALLQLITYISMYMQFACVMNAYDVKCSPEDSNLIID